MMASLRAKTGGGKRSGNGRECKLLPRQNSLVQNNNTRENRPKVPARAGHGAQAAAWNSSLNFVKSPKAANSSSNSTSPETDPGTSDLFPFFKEERGADGEMSDSEREGVGSGSTASAGATAAAAAGASRRASEGKAASSDLDCRNPMFHSANANAEKAVASLFPNEGCEESTRAAMNGSNPMFRRSISSDCALKPRPKAKAEALRRAGSAKIKSAAARTTEDSVLQLHRPSEDGKGGLPKKKKKEKAMYEHVGRMNVRPFQEDEGQDPGQHQQGFRVDTFARNEGEAGGKAHFKFVFTVEEDPLDPPSKDKKSRPVLDAIHERTTGNLRMRVNDGREIGATRSAAVEIAISNIGVVLFNPKTMAKGHHLYTLSLHGRTLFSVLA